MEKVTHKQARQRYLRLFRPVMLIYVVAILGGSYWLSTFEVEPKWLTVSVALASSIPLLLVLLLMLRYFSEADEYTRLKQLTAFSYGAAITIGAVFVAGFLQMFEVIGTVQVFWFGPAFFLAYGLSYKLLGGQDCA